MMMMMMMSTGDIDEECDMEGDRHLYEESFREEQKICLNLGVRCSLREHPGFLAQVCSFTRQEKLET